MVEQCFYKLLFTDSGTPALTSRGFVEEDFAKVADFFDIAVKLALKIKAETKGVYSFLFDFGFKIFHSLRLVI